MAQHQKDDGRTPADKSKDMSQTHSKPNQDSRSGSGQRQNVSDDDNKTEKNPGLSKGNRRDSDDSRSSIL